MAYVGNRKFPSGDGLGAREAGPNVVFEGRCLSSCSRELHALLLLNHASFILRLAREKILPPVGYSEDCMNSLLVSVGVNKGYNEDRP